MIITNSKLDYFWNYYFIPEISSAQTILSININNNNFLAIIQKKFNQYTKHIRKFKHLYFLLYTIHELGIVSNKLEILSKSNFSYNFLLQKLGRISNSFLKYLN